MIDMNERKVFKVFLSYVLITGVLLTTGSANLPLRLGQNASLTCNNTMGGADYIEWRRDDDGTLLANISSSDMLAVFFAPVDDSGLTHDRTFTCIVARNSIQYSQQLRVTIYGNTSQFGHSWKSQQWP